MKEVIFALLKLPSFIENTPTPKPERAKPKRTPHRYLLQGLVAIFWVAIAWLHSGCSRPDASGLIPASSKLAVHVRPAAILQGQVRGQELFSIKFWKLVNKRKVQAGVPAEGLFMLSDFWAFTVPEAPNHWFFLYETPERILPPSGDPSLRSAVLAGKPFSITVFRPDGPVSTQAEGYLKRLADGHVKPWEIAPQVKTSLHEGSHMLLYCNTTNEKTDTSFTGGTAVFNVYFADGIARGNVHFTPNATNRVYGRKLLANDLGMRPISVPEQGSAFAVSIQKNALQESLRYHKQWRSLSLMADFMGLPLRDLLGSAGESIYATMDATHTLALATIDNAKATEKALVRMRRNGGLAGDAPPYELLGQPLWSLQTRDNLLEIRKGDVAPMPKLVACKGAGLWAKLDSAGIGQAAGLFSLQKHPIGGYILPWIRGLEVEVDNLPDGTYRGAFTLTHKIRLVDLMAESKDPVQAFFSH